MARPQKPIQRRANGNFFVRITVDGKRLTKSLETKDAKVAARRAGQAIEELEREAAGPVQPRWKADLVGIEWDVPVTPDGVKADLSLTKERQVEASQIAEPEQLEELSWRDLVREAEQVRKRKTGGGFSSSWHTQMRICLERIPFTLQEASPSLIRGWIQDMQREGLRGRSIELRCAMFRSITTASIKSGLLDGWTNPWQAVDFSSSDTKHIATATADDYQGLGEVLDKQELRVSLMIKLQAYCGTRISEIRRSAKDSYDLEASTLTISEAKNKHSLRTIPIPRELTEQLQGFDFNWPCTNKVNQVLKEVNPGFTSHSLRHGLVRLGRDLEVNADAVEAYVGHRLDGMKSTYGDGFSVESMRTAVEPLWQQLDAWIADK